ncbi:hypothetical protein Cni_G19018 [Canna indica]|uniref:BHLH domain-containing protein n=1 Tax=Canna indica TaxID=4628 RepID=A0AAQ3KLF1_9LILI|nr:hypothetical protein Cni_G19018 [Canna indica]
MTLRGGERLDVGQTVEVLFSATRTELEISKGFVWEGRFGMAVLNAEGETAAKESGGERKRKRRAEPSLSKWRTEGEQKTYSSKLIEALRHVRRSSPAGPILTAAAAATATDHPQSRAVRQAADRALAVAARGRTRWSRAILCGRTLKRRVRPRVGRPKPVGASAAREAERNKPPALEKKAKVLGRLVPGCRKLALPTLLEEVSDYIAALEMQVRAMSAIAEVLSGTGVASSSPPSAEPIKEREGVEPLDGCIHSEKVTTKQAEIILTDLQAREGNMSWLLNVYALPKEGGRAGGLSQAQQAQLVLCGVVLCDMNHVCVSCINMANKGHGDGNRGGGTLVLGLCHTPLGFFCCDCQHHVMWVGRGGEGGREGRKEGS